MFVCDLYPFFYVYMYFLQIYFRQEVIKANVFKSTVAPPTMTLDEFARLEMEGAMERQRRDEEQAQGSSENSDRCVDTQLIQQFRLVF